MYIDFQISTAVIILLGAALVSALLLIPLYIKRLQRVSHAAWRQRTDFAGQADGDVPDSSGLEPASVVVYAQDEAERLSILLPQILGQRYTPGFEVIVVNEGASEATTDVVNFLSLTHSNLYMTFTPDGARNLSRKKLALMLGIKAARNRVVVSTTASAVIESDLWLLSMMRNFANPQTEVVLGYALPVDNDGAMGRRTRAFDYAAQSVTWLSAALGGHPYRGTEFNLAYTRDLFFRNKGFSKSLNLRYGDDDIFVSEIANGANTAVELSPESMVRIMMHNHRRICRDLALRHEFTGNYVTKGPRRAMAAGAWMMWTCLGCSIAAGIAGLANLLGAIIAAVIAVGMLTTVTVSWRKTLVALQSRRLLLTIPWLAMTYPMRNALRTVRCRLHKTRNYTWG